MRRTSSYLGGDECTEWAEMVLRFIHHRNTAPFVAYRLIQPDDLSPLVDSYGIRGSKYDTRPDATANHLPLRLVHGRKNRGGTRAGAHNSLRWQRRG